MMRFNWQRAAMKAAYAMVVAALSAWVSLRLMGSPLPGVIASIGFWYMVGAKDGYDGEYTEHRPRHRSSNWVMALLNRFFPRWPEGHGDCEIWIEDIDDSIPPTAEDRARGAAAAEVLKRHRAERV